MSSWDQRGQIGHGQLCSLFHAWVWVYVFFRIRKKEENNI